MQAFISYSFQDKEIMSKLKSTLQHNGISCYVAEHDENYGGSLSDKLENEIDNRDCVIVILTKNSTISSSVGGEIGYAKKARKTIIPLIESGTDMPILLQGKEYVNFTLDTLDSACQKIARFMNTKLETNNKNTDKDESTDETIIIGENESQIYSYDLEDGKTLVGQIKSNEPIDIFIVNNRNLKLLENEDEFNYEEGIERAKKYKFNFTPPRPGTWNIVIKNEESDDSEVEIFLDIK